MFKKYMHLERLDSREVEGLLSEPCFILPKLDGANASIWWEGDKICCGSRNQQLDENNTLNGFYYWVQENKDKFSKFFPNNCTIYGEWLVSHNIKGYEESAWRKFYVFDIYKTHEDSYCPHPMLENWCQNAKVDYVPILGTTDEITPKVAWEQCTWLMQEGHKHEGVVIKRANYKNHRGEAKWAKYVPERIKTKVKRIEAMAGDMEIAIADHYITEHLIEKEIAKLRVEKGLDRNEISILGASLGRVWHAMITEELWDVMKKFKNPTINFSKLKSLCEEKVKIKFGVK